MRLVLQYKKGKMQRKQGVGHFDPGGHIFYDSMFTVGSLFFAEQYYIWIVLWNKKE